MKVTCAWLTCLLLVFAAGGARAQTLPSEPIALANGRVTISGDVSAGFGSEDLGFFNYTDYEHSALRMLRLDVSTAIKAGPHFTVLGEIRSENLGDVRPYALYLRIKPWTTRDFDIQVGRVPPTFGAFARRTYANDNPLIGYPLAYQYLTTLRPDSIPASADELQRKRSLGWLLNYSLGDQVKDHGVPLVSAFRWDTGVQAHGRVGMISAAVAVTAGTVSNPLFSDDNSGHQVAGRVEVRPVPGLILGTSLARGPFISQSAVHAVLGETSSATFMQTAWGADAEYSRDHYLARIETIVSNWQMPIAATPAQQLALQTPLGALAVSVEGRYKIRPGLYAAARYDDLGFSDLTSAAATLPWDAPVRRIELGAGYSIQRNLVLKGSYQHDTRDGGVLLKVAHMVAAQLVFWF
jgi:hypothetical protein